MNNLPQQNSSVFTNEDEESIDFRKIFNQLLDKWLWFLSCITICLLVAFLYIRYTPPTYKINAKVLVNDDQNATGISKQASSLMDLGGIMGSSNSVDNEAEILKTRFLMEKVVQEMNLNIIYAQRKNLVTRELYESPFKVILVKPIDSIKPTIFTVEKLDNSKISIKNDDFQKIVNWNEDFSLDGIGVLRFTSTQIQNMSNQEYKVSITSIDERVASLMKDLTVSVSNKMVTIIDLGLSYPLPKKGEDILNTLIAKYTAANLSDKNAIADSTSKFIKQRLSVIASELGDVESNLKNFKQQNKLADMSEQGKLLVQNTGSFATELAKAETQVNILTQLEAYLLDENKNKRVFPSSLLPQDVVFSDLMNQYNILLIQRDKILLGVTEENLLVKNLDAQISQMRQGILQNVQNTKNSYVLTRNKLRNQLQEAETQISDVPEVEKDYLKIARSQKIKEELYIFMMQKAEETAISKTANISIAKTIDPPKAEVKPVSPKRSIIYLAGIIIGMIIPISLIFIKDLLNTSISTKEEINALTQVPVIGEISHNKGDDNLIVANQSRSAISEQFRALRTNLSFYLKNKDEKVILLTSSMSGEGKSFTAINLGNILALAGKKVLLMELDLRKPGLSAKLGVLNDIGFSNYTISPDVKIKDIVRPLSINKNMFIIASGPLPPNPAETLMSEHTQTLMDELKKEFDYIIMDAPPVGIITDAQLLSVFADVTLYLVRQKVTQKNQIKIVEELHNTGKMKKLGIVVNDIVSKYYGYGYGYGTYGEEKQEGLFARIFKR